MKSEDEIREIRDTLQYTIDQYPSQIRPLSPEVVSIASAIGFIDLILGNKTNLSGKAELLMTQLRGVRTTEGQ